MKYLAKTSFIDYDGTFCQLSKEFESVSDAVSWIVSYMDLSFKTIPSFDIFPISDDSEASK